MLVRVSWGTAQVRCSAMALAVAPGREDNRGNEDGREGDHADRERTPPGDDRHLFRWLSGALSISGVAVSVSGCLGIESRYRADGGGFQIGIPCVAQNPTRFLMLVATNGCRGPSDATAMACARR